MYCDKYISFILRDDTIKNQRLATSSNTKNLIYFVKFVKVFSVDYLRVNGNKTFKK